MFSRAVENVIKVPLRTMQRHSFTEIEGPARQERVEENEKNKVKVRQKLIKEKYTFCPSLQMTVFL